MPTSTLKVMVGIAGNREGKGGLARISYRRRSLDRWLDQIVIDRLGASVPFGLNTRANAKVELNGWMSRCLHWIRFEMNSNFCFDLFLKSMKI
jgi:hypothetical protein